MTSDQEASRRASQMSAGWTAREAFESGFTEGVEWEATRTRFLVEAARALKDVSIVKDSLVGTALVADEFSAFGCLECGADWSHFEHESPPQEWAHEPDCALVAAVAALDSSTQEATNG